MEFDWGDWASSIAKSSFVSTEKDTFGTGAYIVVIKIDNNNNIKFYYDQTHFQVKDDRLAMAKSFRSGKWPVGCWPYFNKNAENQTSHYHQQEQIYMNFEYSRQTSESSDEQPEKQLKPKPKTLKKKTDNTKKDQRKQNKKTGTRYQLRSQSTDDEKPGPSRMNECKSKTKSRTKKKDEITSDFESELFLPHGV